MFLLAVSALLRRSCDFGPRVRVVIFASLVRACWVDVELNWRKQVGGRAPMSNWETRLDRNWEGAPIHRGSSTDHPDGRHLDV